MNMFSTENHWNGLASELSPEQLMLVQGGGFFSDVGAFFKDVGEGIVEAGEWVIDHLDDVERVVDAGERIYDFGESAWRVFNRVF